MTINAIFIDTPTDFPVVVSLNYQAVSLFPNSFDDGGANHTLPGWTWYDDIAYGAKGWIRDNFISYLNGDRPASFDKTDYGNGNEVSFDAVDFAPTKTVGASMHITAGTAVDNRTTWWVWKNGRSLASEGITDLNTNRMSFYFKMEGTPAIPDADSVNFPTSSAELGTYLCWEGTGDGTGNGCPYESPNQHWYHWITPNPGAWIHCLLDAAPQHQRGVALPPVNEPALVPYGKYYFENFQEFYAQQAAVSGTQTEFWIDEIEFYSLANTPEANQNDESVCTLWVGYWAGTDNWEIGFMDNTVDGDIKKTYEVRWSTAEITNANWGSANSIEPLNYGGVAATGNINLLSRPNGNKLGAWTKFTLPVTETTGEVYYFAVKDVSVLGGNIGASYPWNRGDDADADNDFVKTINYVIP